MPSDTGAPWLLPYPEDTDLVRDGADDIEALATATASALHVISFTSVTKSDAFSASVALGANADVTGLAVTITPATSSSQFLVFWDVSGSADTAGMGIVIKRNTAGISLGTAVGSRGQVTAGGPFQVATRGLLVGSGSLLDAPATASAVTYQVAVQNLRGATDNLYVNRTSSDSDSVDFVRSASRLTVLEVE